MQQRIMAGLNYKDNLHNIYQEQNAYDTELLQLSIENVWLELSLLPSSIFLTNCLYFYYNS